MHEPLDANLPAWGAHGDAGALCLRAPGGVLIAVSANGSRYPCTVEIVDTSTGANRGTVRLREAWSIVDGDGRYRRALALVANLAARAPCADAA